MRSPRRADEKAISAVTEKKKKKENEILQKEIIFRVQGRETERCPSQPRRTLITLVLRTATSSFTRSLS